MNWLAWRQMKNRKKQFAAWIFLLLFSVASIAALLPDSLADADFGATAAELKTTESWDGNVSNTSFIDSEGAVTTAIDIGYATVQRTWNDEGKIEKEYYFDAAGDPVRRYNEYCGIAYEYGKNTVRITYLDENGSPLVWASGYSTIVRTLDADGRAVDDYYYDLDMHPVSYNGYYGVHQDYDSDGQNIRTTCLDKKGQPVCNTSGYAVRVYDKDASGTVTAEHYFDTLEAPATSALGQYGEVYKRDANGWITQITYLAANGAPTPVRAGYTVVKRTYHRNGTIAMDRYFDASGTPVALSKGQYGIRYSGNVSLLLDKNGHVMFCVDNILNGFPCMVVVFGCIICALLLFLPKKTGLFLTAAYVVFILYETLMFREVGDARTNFVLFSYADRFFTEQSVRVGVINNIWLFIPFGTGLYRNIRKKWVLLLPFLLSVLIETTQYITGLGIAEFDDVFGNTLGGWIGIMVAVEIRTGKLCRDARAGLRSVERV